MNAPRRQPSFWNASFRIFGMSLGEMLWSKRTFYMLLVVAAPLAIAVVGRLIIPAGNFTVRINGARLGGAGVFGMMMWVLFVRFTVPVLGVLYGTGIVADEVDDRTITYLFTRPIPRGAVVIGKYLAYLVCTTLVVLPALVILFFIVVRPVDIGSMLPLLLQDLGVLALGLAAYGALFALVGAVVRRPLVVGLLFVFGWEQLALSLPGYLQRATIAHYVHALVPHPAPGGSISRLFNAFAETPSPAAAIAWLVGALAVFLILAVRAVSAREYVLEQ